MAFTKVDATRWVQDMTILPPAQILQPNNVVNFVQTFFECVLVADQALVGDLEVVLKRVLRDPQGFMLFHHPVAGSMLVTQLRAGLTSRSPELQAASFSVLSVVATHKEGIHAIISTAGEDSILHLVVQGFGESARIAALTSKIVVSVCGEQQGLEAFCSAEVQASIDRCVGENGQNILRVVDAVIEIAQRHENALTKLCALRWFDCLETTLRQQEDGLVRVSAFEVLCSAASTAHPHTASVVSHFVRSASLMSLVCTSISSALDALMVQIDPLIALVATLALNFVAHAAQQGDEVVKLILAAGILPLAVAVLKSADVDIQTKEAGIHFVFHLSQTEAGKSAIADDRMIAWVGQQEAALKLREETAAELPSSSSVRATSAEPRVAIMSESL